VAVNVIRQPGDNNNILSNILSGWFGPIAGQPGNNQSVEFSWKEGALELKPVLLDVNPVTSNAAVLGQEYNRNVISGMFGIEYNEPFWRQGYMHIGKHIFLLVTLDKSGQPEELQYEDRFLSRSLFEWQSQNRHTQDSKAGQAMLNHVNANVEVHLFIRKYRKVSNKTAPFIYCGNLEFVSWEGNKPITVQWRLKVPLSDNLAKLFDAT